MPKLCWRTTRPISSKMKTNLRPKPAKPIQVHGGWHGTTMMANHLQSETRKGYSIFTRAKTILLSNYPGVRIATPNQSRISTGVHTTQTSLPHVQQMAHSNYSTFVLTKRCWARDSRTKPTWTWMYFRGTDWLPVWSRSGWTMGRCRWNCWRRSTMASNRIQTQWPSCSSTTNPSPVCNSTTRMTVSWLSHAMTIESRFGIYP